MALSPQTEARLARLRELLGRDRDAVIDLAVEVLWQQASQGGALAEDAQRELAAMRAALERRRARFEDDRLAGARLTRHKLLP